MNNLDAALAWCDLGLPVFPCYEQETWEGNNLHTRKSPRTRRGFYDAFTDRDAVEQYWRANPTHLVGVWCRDVLVVLDIDNDPERGVDGQFELDANGIVPPNTFSVITPRGGSHHFFQKPDGVDVGPSADITLPNGVVLKGVDRRAGNSYFIAWASAVPSSLGELAMAPHWLLVSSRSAERAHFLGPERDWFERLPLGDPDDAVLRALDRIPSGNFAHDEMRDRQLELVRLGAEGHPGVGEALLTLRSRWLCEQWNTPEWERDWNASLVGAIRKYGGSPEGTTHQSDVDDFANKVQRRLLDLKVNFEAESLLLAEGSRDTEIVTLEQLATMEQEYLVDSLVPASRGIVVLVGKRSQGKTFAYIDMVLSIIFGMPWMGKKTKPVKVLIALGEGHHGFYERLVAWCDYHGKSLEEVKNSLTFVTGVNLNNPVSVKKLGVHIEDLGIELCVIDTWAAVSGLADEDKAALVSRTLNKMEDAAGNATVLITHHPNKSSEDAKRLVPRGSGAFEGRADVVICLQPDKKFNSRSGLKEEWLSISTDAERGGKNRSASQETIRGAYLKPHAGSRVWAQDPSSLVSEGASHVLNNLKGSTTTKAYAKATGVSESTAGRYLQVAVEEGVATRSEPARRNEPAVYSLSIGGLARLAP